MADLKISALNSLAGADLVAADVVAVVDDSASETKKLTVSDLIANGSTLISDNTIPSAKILFSAGSIDTAELAASAVETAKINDSAVTAAKLADNSSVTLVSTLPASGDFTGQIALDTDDDKIYVWDGSAWDSVKGAGSINVVNGSTSGIVNITTSTSGDTVTVSTTLDDTTAAAQFLAGPTGSAGTVGYRALVGTDLPTATTTAKGGIIVNGEGLRMDSDTIEIDNDITANSSTFQAVKFDSKGLITSGRDITSADLPDATDGATGAVKPGTGLEMGTAGAIDHSNSVAAATNTKITYDAQGHVTAGTTLAASDIPDLDTAKITTGTFPTARIASDAITADKLANYTVAQISETTPTADFTSQFFFNPITRDLFLWDGNVFQPVGISAGEIVLAGTYDASTNLLDSVTAEGSAAGFTNGQSLPAADTGNNRYYVVVTQTGTGSAPAPTVTLEPPDILLSNGTSYVLVETSETITAQVASNVGFTPTGNIAGTNVQAALSEVDSEKVAKAGDTMTGDLTLNNANVVFEGATENDFETTLTVVDPTADNTLSLPNVSGTLVSTGDTGTVTSTMIADGTIANADISASAEIAVSKLANGTARQLLQTDAAGTGVEFTSNVDVPGTLDVTGAATFDSTAAVTGLISADGKVKFPAGTASAPSFYFGTDTNTGFYHPAADKVAITTGGTQRVVVDSSGNLGIGAASPSSKLHVDHDINAEAYTIIENSRNYGFGVGIDFKQPFANAGSSIVGGRIRSDYESDNNSFFAFSTLQSGTLGEKLRIDSSGRVGIGSTNPTALLECRTTGTTDAAYEIQRWSTTNGGILGILVDQTQGNPTWTFRSATSEPIAFQQGGTERLRIDSSGRVGIGTASPGRQVHISNSTTAELHFTNDAIGNTSSDGSTIYVANTGELGIRNRENSFTTFYTNNTERMRIDSSGNVGIGLTNPTDTGSFGRALDISGSNGSAFYCRNNGSATNTATFGYYGTDLYVQNRATSGGTMRFDIAGSERMRIDSSGRLLVGTTSQSGTANQASIHSVGKNTLSIIDTTSYASGVGGAINLGGNYRSTGDAQAFVRISAVKENSTNANYAYGIQFDTTANGGSSFGTSAMRIDSSGNVGIGTTSPGQPLHVVGTIRATTDFQLRDSSDNRVLVIEDASNDARISNEVNGGDIIFRTNSGSNVERMRIASDGNVLLGTTVNNGANLVVNQAGANSPATSGNMDSGFFLGIEGTGSSALNMGADGTNVWYNAAYANNSGVARGHAFYTGATERMRISSDGLFSTFFATNGITARSAGGAGTTNFLYRGMYNGTNNTAGGTVSYYVYSNGNVQNTNNSYGSISDAKLKENIVDAASQWEDLKAIQVRKYNFKEETGHETHTQLGVVAQEVELVSPGLVSEAPDKDVEGNDLGTTTKSVNYSVLYMKAVKALQEAMERIETLEAKVAALEAG